jgi:Flp pilus assembly protein TadB
MNKDEAKDVYQKILDEKISNWIWKWRVFAFLPVLIIMAIFHYMGLSGLALICFLFFTMFSLVFPYVLFFSMGKKGRDRLREKLKKAVDSIIYKEKSDELSKM